MIRSVVLASLCALAVTSNAAPILQSMAGATQPFRLTLSPSTEPTIVEATADFIVWTAIVTNPPNPAPLVITDPQSPAFSRRFYRVRTVPPPLPDLGQLANSVFMAGEGFNTVQFAPNGKLGFIAWRGSELIYRERIAGAWSERSLGTVGATYVPGVSEEYRFQPHAALLFDSQSRAHILRLAGSSIIHSVQQPGGTFSDTTPIALSGIGSSFSLFSAALGPSDKLHVALVGSQTSAAISYGSDRSGSWQWTTVTSVAGNPRGFLRQSWAPRWFSMAVDSQNNAHLTFCPQFVMGRSPEGYLRPYSELHYASNRGGNWITQKIADVADGSGDAGNGASIAIGPDGEPAIAAWYNERWPTGSSDFCRLYYYNRSAGGTWQQQLLASSADAYLAGDGNKGTGFAPYLRFDPQGRPHIAFCDDAAQHFASSGQNEYAGNLRHAYFNGSQWVIRTVLPQTGALDWQIVYPAFAVSSTELVFAGLTRNTVWQQPDYRVATSTYRFFLVTSVP